MAPIEERSGVLVVRTWVEGAEPQGLRARIIQIPAEGDEHIETTAATVDEILAAVRSWLENLVFNPQS